MAWNALELASLLFCAAAVFGYVNHYTLRLPRNVGLLVLALAVALALRVVETATDIRVLEPLRARLIGADFAGLLLNFFLCLLLFAGARDVRLADLLAHKGTILALATAGVALSAVLVAGGMWGIFRLVGVPVPFAPCLVFGALISPTDPVTVLGVLRQAGVPPGLQAIIAGESLFNDGIGIVLYTLFLGLAAGSQDVDPAALLVELARQGGGGALLGLVTGLAAVGVARSIDEHNTELMISLALATGTYGLALTLDVSGPVAVVVAGLLMGSVGARYAFSARTRDHLATVWSAIDELLNALLFLMIGLEFALVPIEPAYLAAACLAIPLAVLVRVVSVALPGIPLNLAAPHKARAVAVLSWSGIRGGISVALALSLPEGPWREPLLTATYAVVIFTMVGQGLTLGRLSRWLYGGEALPRRA